MTFAVGEYRIDPVIDGHLRFRAATFYPNVPDEQWLPHQQFLDEDGRITMPVGGFLVRGNGDRVVLVDAGVGLVEAFPKIGGRLLDSLAELGCSPDQVTDVLFSHLHFDHIGWASKDGQAVFPNATYRCHSKDWDYFITGQAHQGEMAESAGLPTTANFWLDPVSDRFSNWDGDSTVLPGFDVRDAPGHTPGSTVLVISSGAERAVLLGDAVHCPAELLESEWEMIGDIDKDLARKTREALAREYEGTNIPMAAPHFPGMQFGRLLPAQGKLSFVFD